APTTPLSAVRPLADEQVQVGVIDAPGEVGSYRLTAQGVSGSQGDFTVLVAAVQDPIDATVAKVAVLLAVGLPVIVLIVGAATYTLVGRSLRPVERIRAGVASISTSDLAERVPVPESRDEIAQLAETMNSMLTRLEAGHLAQQRFVGDASHELRSPLATLTAGLELGRTHPELLDRALISETMLPEAQRMQALVDDLLLLARVDEQGLPLRVTEVDLDDLLEREAARVRTMEGITLRAEIHPVRVHGDAAQLARALRNLVDNAVRHARATVLIGCSILDDTAAMVVIGDDGPGIADADRVRVFERFVRLDADRGRSTGGSGLGLAIVAEILAAHGGAVEIGDSPAGGAQFTVILPTAGPGQLPVPSNR
ncbi:MAG: ATP-binding protein, partial [Nakamurella sp.]